MTPPLDLFDLIWGEPATRGRIACGLDAHDWARIDAVAGQHRMRPLLRARLNECGARAAIPTSLAARWRRLHDRASLLALRQQVELARILRLLGAGGIEAIALKGAGFVWRGWIEPALRPMRDLDILVSEADALQAHATLRRCGYEGVEAQELTAEKHLPGLISPETRVQVEIHTSLIAPRRPDWPLREAAFRQRALSRTEAAVVTGSALPAFEPTDTLLHLVIHGALDHQFNNGPLLLSDIAVLVAHGTIDWSRFWAEAEMLDAARACQLALRLAESHARVSDITWPVSLVASPPAEVVDAAAAMLFVNLDRRSELGWVGQVAGQADGNGMSNLGAMVRRRWHATADSAGRRNHAKRLAILIRAAGRYATTLANSAARNHIRQSLRVARWIRGN